MTIQLMKETLHKQICDLQERISIEQKNRKNDINQSFVFLLSLPFEQIIKIDEQELISHLNNILSKEEVQEYLQCIQQIKELISNIHTTYMRIEGTNKYQTIKKELYNDQILSYLEQSYQEFKVSDYQNYENENIKELKIQLKKYKSILTMLNQINQNKIDEVNMKLNELGLETISLDQNHKKDTGANNISFIPPTLAPAIEQPKNTILYLPNSSGLYFERDISKFSKLELQNLQKILQNMEIIKLQFNVQKEKKYKSIPSIFEKKRGQIRVYYTPIAVNTLMILFCGIKKRDRDNTHQITVSARYKTFQEFQKQNISIPIENQMQMRKRISEKYNIDL